MGDLPSNVKRIYLIAGEASGDLHGGMLMKAFRAENPKLQFRFWGGEQMEAEGGVLVKHYKELAFMGFVEVIANLRTILKNIALCKKDILVYKPDCLVLIDYPGFNLRIAKWAKKQGIRVVYYISPQIWAWRTKRVHRIMRDTDQLFTILPFEPDFYKQFNYEVEFEGHPLVDIIDQYKAAENFKEKFGLDNRPVIALLPGSRKQEIRKMLSLMLVMQPHFEAFQFVVAGAPGQDADFYKPFLTNSSIKLVMNETYELLSYAKAALVTSGTATLETALFGVPQVVCYKGSRISFAIAKRLIKVPYISLVNLIMNKEVVRELIQSDLNEESLQKELGELLEPEKAAQMKQAYRELRMLLGNGGVAPKVVQKILYP